MENQVSCVVLLLVLAGAAYEDLKEKRIHVFIPVGAAAIGLLLHLLWRQRTFGDVLLGMAVGVAVLLPAVLGRGSIGAGDGMILAACGIFLGFWANLTLLMTALMFAGMAALFLLVIKRKGRNYRMPFVPFLLAAYLFGLL